MMLHTKLYISIKKSNKRLDPQNMYNAHCEYHLFIASMYARIPVQFLIQFLSAKQFCNNPFLLKIEQIMCSTHDYNVMWLFSIQ